MTTRIINIKEVPNVIDDHLLDIIGNEFKFDHVKGMAELLKNSVDAYRRNDFRQEDQHVIFRFIDQGLSNPQVECIDFVGMTKVDIEASFKRWGDPNAAKRGNKSGKKLYGGHGNGGKFYMRQMFKESRFITYKEGVLNIFGFSAQRKYGFAEGYHEKKMTPKQAIEFAEIVAVIPSDMKNKIMDQQTGFTLVQGVGPEGVRGKFKVPREIERLKNHPQSRRIILRANVSVIYNDHVLYENLQPNELEPLENFKEARIITVPEKLATSSGSEKVTVVMGNDKYPLGKLILKTSSEALSRGTILGELNRIDILGEIGVIGSYSLYEIGVNNFPAAGFIYGEFGPSQEGEASILEDPENDCVSNDRTKLVANDTTKALLEWIAVEVDKLASEIAAIEREKQKANQKDITSKFNDVLNAWKNKHMSKIMSDLFGAGTEGGTGGGPRPTPETKILPPPNGFDFKYPRAEIELGKSVNLTLKVCVPQTLPIGATIFASSDSEKVAIEVEKYHVKSEYIKSDDNGQDIAFINIEAVGSEVGAEATITATDKKNVATMTVVVIEEKKSDKGKSFPQVLLSSHDKDPLSTDGSSVVLGDRDPIVYQRPQDLTANIYWINTSSPMASKIYDKFRFDSPQWRTYLFDRYVDIFVKEAIHDLEKKDFQNFTADTVDRRIEEVVRKVHQSANEDLEQFLFEPTYIVPSTLNNNVEST
jgi:hypothetical protein